MRIVLFASLVLAVGCSKDTGFVVGDGGVIEGLQTIRVDPPDAVLSATPTQAATQTFKAFGMFADGKERDITDAVTWSSSAATYGSFAGNVFTSTKTSGGVTDSIATASGKQGKGKITVQFAAAGSDPSLSTGMPSLTDEAAAALFAGGAASTDPAMKPDLVYPNDGVVVPPNLGELEFHFRPRTGQTVFELSFKNNITNVKVYLKCPTQLDGGCIYKPSAVQWAWIAETNRGGANLDVQLRATDAMGTTVSTSNAIKLGFTQDDIRGALYYWTTSADTGIVRFDFASGNQTSGSLFLAGSTNLTDNECVGCHALSRDGTKMAAAIGGQDDGRLALLDVASRELLLPVTFDRRSNFEAWNPAGDQFLGVYADDGATNFGLRLFDATNGNIVTTLNGTNLNDHPANHPDWSLDGNDIVYVRQGRKGTNQRFGKGSLWTIERSGDTFGDPTQLVAEADGRNRYYPAIAPDNQLVVFNESICPGGDEGSRDCNADTDPTAKLYSVSLSGGAPVELKRANAPGREDGTNTNLTSSFPRWSPFVFQRTSEFGSKVMWMTFSSSRKFGLRTTPDSTGDEPNERGSWLWMVAIDPSNPDGDPSFAPFALPFQDLTTSNHIAQWTTVAVGPIE